MVNFFASIIILLTFINVLVYYIHMLDKDGHELNIGDYVSVRKRCVNDKKGINYGVLVRVDKHGYGAKSLVIGDNNGFPTPLACRTSGLRVIDIPEYKKIST